MIELAEVKIYGLNELWGDEESGADALELMREVYESVLSNDSKWHFFWEGDYTVIRCDPFYTENVRQYFSSFDDFTAVQMELGYQENIWLTKKYLKAFVPIFHGLSLLAMELDNEDFLLSLERINHCYLNMVTREELKSQFRIPGEDIYANKGMAWEALAISSVAHMRMHFCGMLAGLSKQHKQENKHVKQED